MRYREVGDGEITPDTTKCESLLGMARGGTRKQLATSALRRGSEGHRAGREGRCHSASCWCVQDSRRLWSNTKRLREEGTSTPLHEADAAATVTSELPFLQLVTCVFAVF